MATFTYWNGADPTGTITGDSGNDLIDLRTNSSATDLTFDLRNLHVQSIENISFSPGAGTGHDLALLLNGAELDNVPGPEFSANLHITGTDLAGYTETLKIFAPQAAWSIDLSGWTFSAWGGQEERVVIFGATQYANDIISTSQADEIHGGEANDLLRGGPGNDEIHPGSGNDTAWGGAGDDALYDDFGVNVLRGEAGDDIFVYQDGRDVQAGAQIDGGAGSDLLYLETTTPGADTTFNMLDLDILSIEKIQFRPLFASGHDLRLWLSGSQVTNAQALSHSLMVIGYDIDGYQERIEIEVDSSTPLDLSGWTFVNWGAQGERIGIVGRDLADKITGSSQADEILGYGGNDVINGGGGNDQLDGGAGNDTVHGGDGDDTLLDLDGVNNLFGDAGNDRFVYREGRDAPAGTVIDGGAGTDHLVVETTTAASDTLFDLRSLDLTSIDAIDFQPYGGAAQNLELRLNGDEVAPGGGLSANTAVSGHDASGYKETLAIYMNVATQVDLSGWSFANWGGQGEEIRIYGDASAETLIGSSRNDVIVGAEGGDTLKGNTGNDWLDGGDGDDALWSGAGDDTLKGWLGNDVLNDEGGTNKLYGEEGDDTLVLWDGRYFPAASVIDGGPGVDTLKVATTSLFVPYTALTFSLWDATITSIEKIAFSPLYEQDFELRISAAQVNGGGFSSNLEVIGSTETGTKEYLKIRMGSEKTLDLSGWSFTNWNDANETVRIEGDTDAETITGSDARDSIYAGGGNDTLRGRGGNDTLIGLSGNDTLAGGDGNDSLYGGTGQDKLWGNRGNDELRGEEQPDELHGGFGLDKLFGGNGNDTLYGDAHADELHGGNDDDVLWGGNGNDTLYGDARKDTLHGGNDDDVLWGGNGDDTLYGEAQDDILHGGNDKDVLWGGSGNDTLYGEAQDDILHGGLNDDVLWGGGGNDTLYGEGQNDTLHGGKNDDTLWGGGGNDTLYGEEQNDTLHGGNANDKLYGGTGADKLFGEAHNDFLYGGQNNDLLDGGKGYDRLWGNQGADTFVHRPGHGTDRIMDFQNDQDKIDLKGWGFATVSAAMGYATQVGSDVKFDFSTASGGQANDVLWVLNTTVAQLSNDIIV